MSLPSQAGSGRDIWLYDVGRGLRTRFTFGPAIASESIWSPDGSRLVFRSNRKGQYNLYQKASSGVGAEEVVLEDNLSKSPVSWSPDGRIILYASSGGPTGLDLFALPLSGELQAVSVSQHAVQRDPGPIFSRRPVGCVPVKRVWHERGLCRLLSGSRRKRQISSAGGVDPRWSHDGKEIFYLTPDDKLMAASVNQ